MENEKKMKQQILEAKEGVRLSIYTGMLEYGHIDIPWQQAFAVGYSI